ncbi:hypothetical protein V511_14275 [Mesotoga sp. Brook.08.YT.4.2.5.1]|jgi:uncharacterized protein YbbK (DUF523 family)|uniref:Uncharacterized protein n=1 Tax=Mesotoga prima TaxID=1184387 RepID=A0A101HM06_9BACT|nr:MULTISPECIES: DUF523 domain-containing protein [unclassified Mesotoga]KUK79293.1 MAG: Uncharacterized protein XD94_1422 [Mesotoga prima]PNQ05841.1 hypothetical protein RM69_02705 [Mesotoga sp. SC_NapDC3]PXF35084.1 hypothetical protein EU77_03815 [Mesotoga sp. SC_NapDC]RAM60562.1 hypothetical protein DS67_06335 [Mesotoga sp. SC_4PWA21]RAM61030.1 hypothetical protein DS66_02810 [Mesotoga sp. SC_3PWM13N19]
MTKILVSACLIGVNCTYRGDNNLSFKLLELVDRFVFLPVCPEQLGGLPTPRPRAEVTTSKDWLASKIVLDQFGNDVTSNYEKGAEEVLKIAKLSGSSIAVLKSRSPSCGCRGIYDGTFSGVMIDGMGITAELLMKNGIEVYSEEETSFLY